MKHKTRYLKIACFCCALRIEDEDIGKYFDATYRFYARSRPGRYQAHIFRREGNLVIKSPSLRTELEAGQAVDIRYVDFLVMVHIALQALKDNILFLHASSYVREGKGYAYYGESGAGKSTAVAKIVPYRIYSDDTAVMRKEKGVFFLYPSAFDRKSVRLLHPGPVPLEKIYLIRKAQENRESDVPFTIKFLALKGSDIYLYIINRLFKSGYRFERRKLYGLFLDLIAGVEMKKLKFTKS